MASGVLDKYVAGLWAEDDAADIREFGEDLRTAAEADIVSYVVSIVGDVLAILVVRHLTKLVREAPVVS